MTVNGYVELAKAAAQRTFIPGSDSMGSGQDDVATPGLIAWTKEARAARCLDACLGMLAVVASQALFVTDRKAPLPLGKFVELVRTYVAPVIEDRILGPGARAAGERHHCQYFRARRAHRLDQRVNRRSNPLRRFAGAARPARMPRSTNTSRANSTGGTFFGMRRSWGSPRRSSARSSRIRPARPAPIRRPAKRAAPAVPATAAAQNPHPHARP